MNTIIKVVRKLSYAPANYKLVYEAEKIAKDSKQAKDIWIESALAALPEDFVWCIRTSSRNVWRTNKELNDEFEKRHD